MLVIWVLHCHMPTNLDLAAVGDTGFMLWDRKARIGLGEQAPNCDALGIMKVL
jgi:hypothetical protein